MPAHCSPRPFVIIAMANETAFCANKPGTTLAQKNVEYLRIHGRMQLVSRSVLAARLRNEAVAEMKTYLQDAMQQA